MLRYSRLTSTPSHLFFAFLLQLLPADHLHQNTFHAAMLVTKQAPVVNGPELPIMPWIFWLKQKLYPKHPNMFTSMEKNNRHFKKRSPPLPPQKEKSCTQIAQNWNVQNLFENRGARPHVLGESLWDVLGRSRGRWSAPLRRASGD